MAYNKFAHIFSASTSLKLPWDALVDWYAYQNEVSLERANKELEDFRQCQGVKRLGELAPVVDRGSVVGVNKNSAICLSESKELSSETYYLIDPRMTRLVDAPGEQVKVSGSRHKG